MKPKVDYIIVGQGIAGSFLAFHLLVQNKSFLLIDRGLKMSSSLVAAGLINPVALKRLTLGWRANEFYKYNRHFYSTLESALGKKYFFPTPIKKLIASEEEAKFWVQRYEKGGLSGYIKKGLQERNKDFFNSKILKYGIVNSSAWLNVSSLLFDFRIYLKKNNLLCEEFVKTETLVQSKAFKGVQGDKIVFCEGARATKNPLFSHLPFALNKGQLINIRTKELNPNEILKKKAFILRSEKANHFRIGSSYAWKWEDEQVEVEKTRILRQQLSEMVNINYEFINADSGIRPAARDRRPLLGKSDQYSDCFIFNGLGSKGCFMAPLLAKELYEYMEMGTPLAEESDIERFKKS